MRTWTKTKVSFLENCCCCWCFKRPSRWDSSVNGQVTSPAGLKDDPFLCRPTHRVSVIDSDRSTRVWNKFQCFTWRVISEIKTHFDQVSCIDLDYRPPPPPVWDRISQVQWQLKGYFPRGLWIWRLWCLCSTTCNRETPRFVFPIARNLNWSLSGVTGPDNDQDQTTTTLFGRSPVLKFQDQTMTTGPRTGGCFSIFSVSDISPFQMTLINCWVNFVTDICLGQWKNWS